MYCVFVTVAQMQLRVLGRSTLLRPWRWYGCVSVCLTASLTGDDPNRRV